MRTIVLDANAVIMHGRAFADRVRQAVDRSDTLVVPRAVKRELVDDVLEDEDTPANHRRSARTTQELIDDGYLVIRAPDFEGYSQVIDEARRRPADDELPEHAVKADQYIPALVCELAQDDAVQLVTADRKLRRIVCEITKKHGVHDRVTVHYPRSLL